jgi:hypothetical protein
LRPHQEHKGKGALEDKEGSVSRHGLHWHKLKADLVISQYG